MQFDFKENSVGLLAIGFGLFYWPLETLIHVTFFEEGSFLDLLLYPSADEVWMRLLVSLSFIAFGLYAHRAIRQQQDMNKLLHQQKVRARSVIESAHDAYVCIDTNSVITDWNPQAEKMFGWTRSEAVGSTLLDTIIPERFHQAHQYGIQAYLKNSSGPWLYKPVATSARLKGGGEIQVEMAVVPLSSEEKQEFYAFIRKITE